MNCLRFPPPSSIATRAVRYLGLTRPAGRLLKKPHLMPPLASSISTKIDRVIDGVMDKEFPGYFDADHHKTHTLRDSVLDVHDHRLDLEDATAATLPASLGGRMNCEKVKKLLEQHHSIDECEVIDINVDQIGEIPVAFVVKRLGSEGCDTEFQKQLIGSLRLICADHHHEELEKDLIAKFNSIMETNEIKDDLIKDDLINCVREKFGPYAILKVVVVDALPKTICGRVLRGTLCKIARRQPYSITPMIEDRGALEDLEKEIHKLLGAQYA